MVLQDFISSMGKLDILTHVGLDDFADKLNFLFTVWILSIFCSITTVKTYFLNPISCYVPTIVGSHEGQASYINNICYSEGTYNVPINEFKIDAENPYWHLPYQDRKIYYYQWLPFLLGVQGIMFYIPRIIWYLFANSRTGSDLSQLIKIAHEAQKADGEKREKLVGHVVKQLQLWLINTRELANSNYTTLRQNLYNRLKLFLPSKRLGTWLVLIYFLIKCVYIANLMLQLMLMTKVLQVDKLPENRNLTTFQIAASFGAELFADLISGKDWKNTGLFPRSGCCAVHLRQAAASQPIFAQCAIPVNMIHEKLFIFLWFWFLFVLVMTIISLLLWLARMLTLNRRCKLLKKLLYLADFTVKKDEEEKAQIREFTKKFLRHDGTFVIFMISMNCGEVVSTDICADLYRSYKYEHHKHYGDLRGFPDESYVVNASGSNLALSPNNCLRNSTIARKRKDSSSCNSDSCNLQIEKRKSHVEPSAPLLEEGINKSAVKICDETVA